MGGERRVFGGSRPNKRLLIVAGLIFAFAGIAYYFIFNYTRPAQIKLEFPQVTQVNQEISVPLKLSTARAMNAAEFYFSFPNELLEVKKIDKTGSFFTLWITGYPKFDNSAGTISFAGGLPTPGFTAEDGLIATVVFTAKKAGLATVILDQEHSQVLANDSFGTVIESVFEPVKLTIQ
jgi:hypothetical protein